MTDTIIDTRRIDRAGLAVAEPLARFIEERALPGTGIEPAAFRRSIDFGVKTMSGRRGRA